VMTNLLSNAVKYNKPGGQVEVATERRGGQVALRITDTGLGMDPKQLERIFRPFERLGAESTAIPGTGLGLALSQQLVARMGGRIEVESTPGQGTTFTVLLRAAIST
jgi:signal transduction histidine kinase